MSDTREISFPLFVREIRDRMCLTRAEFGALLDVTSHTVMRWETGASRRPRRKKHLRKLQELYDMTMLKPIIPHR